MSTVALQGIGFVAAAQFAPIGCERFFHATVATAGAMFLKLPAVWVIANGCFPLLASDSFDPTAAAIAVLLLLAVFLPTLWTRIPFYPTEAAAYTAIAGILEQEEFHVFYDLGSGFGHLLFWLAPRFPNIVFVGYEVSPLAYLISRLRSVYHPNVRIYFKSFWSCALDKPAVVYAFLSPEPMARLEEKIRAELPRESIFISNSFPLPRSEAVQELQSGEQILYVYTQRRYNVKMAHK
jgi:SAM-dependent methyltransferase